MNEQIDPVEGQMETEPQGHWEIPKYEGEIPQGPAQVQVDHSMYRTPATVETQVQHQEMPDRYELGLDKESYGPGVVDSWEQSFQRNGYSQQEAKFKADEYAGVVDQVRQAERQEYEEQVREDLQASIDLGFMENDYIQTAALGLAKYDREGLLKERLGQHGLDIMPELMQILHEVGSRMQQPKGLSAQGQPPQGKRDPFDDIWEHDMKVHQSSH